ncbi:MAG: hypothetical protein KIT15_11440 [Xanthobacteraceae bacterium]|nr:hypothetical protein [Xanthobacteraceae bacterium]MCW5675180.1 hypothetical protein [Xanthobacteraceae bacterium]
MEKSLRPVSNVFSLAHFCDRASCKRTKTCRGNGERCLTLYSDCVPLAAREFVVDLMVSRELGYSFEEAMRRNRDGVRAFAAWTPNGLQANVASQTKFERSIYD